MFRWLRNFLGRKTQGMSNNENKRIVGYDLLGDGIRPAEVGSYLIVRMPLEVELVPGQPQTLNLGIAFDQPALLYPAKHLADIDDLVIEFRGATGRWQGCLLMPGHPVIVDFSLEGRNHLRIDEKEAAVVVLFPGGADGFRKNS